MALSAQNGGSYATVPRVPPDRKASNESSAATGAAAAGASKLNKSTSGAAATSGFLFLTFFGFELDFLADGAGADTFCDPRSEPPYLPRRIPYCRCCC